MWNTWVDKAKTAAAKIDQQINESVGLEEETPTVTTATDSAVLGSGEVSKVDNGWNDDFDDGFDDDEVAPPSFAPVPTIVAPPPTAATVVQVPPPLPPQPKIPEPVVADPPAAPNHVIPEPTVADIDQVEDETPVQVAPEPEPVAAEGWDQEEDPILDDSEECEEPAMDFDPPPSPPDANAIQKEAFAAASNMFSSFTAKAAPMSSTMFSSLTAKAAPMSSILSATLKSQSTSHEEETPIETPPVNTLLAAEEEPAETPAEAGWDGDDLDIPGDDILTEDLMEDPVIVRKEEVYEEPVPEPTPVLEQPSPPEVKEAVPEPPTVVEPPAPDLASPPSPEPQTVSPVRAASPAPFVPALSDDSMAAVALAPTPSAAPVNIEADPRFQRLQTELMVREEQLANKSQQLTELQTMCETQEQELRQKIQETKEEAKKRITKARERCEAAEAKLQQQATSKNESVAGKNQMIDALREEGQSLAKKQSDMERAVRAAKGEARDLSEELETETAAKKQALEKIVKLEVDLKSTKDNLNAARKGESLSEKLENDLLAARSDAEIKGATIMSLEQQLKELKAEGKELREEVGKSQKLATQEANQESKKVRREHTGVIEDLETKLRTSEREAGVREDALRHEVSELRKRWEDAVRRADALSMDVQSSTAPLLRQLESMERQNRARAAAWAELENKLRSELEETVIQNETLSRERSEFKTKYTRLERMTNERESELKACRSTIEDQTLKVSKLEVKMEELEAEAEKRQEEYVKVERLANEGVARVRSEMTQTVVDSEERYRGQIEKLEKELHIEQEKRSQLEMQVEQLLDSTGMTMAPQAPQAIRREATPKRLKQSQGQAEILAGALSGLGDSDDEDDAGIGMSRSEDESDVTTSKDGGMSSYAALEQLNSRLKIAQVELESLRASLKESERTRESLLEELSESRQAKEKLPLFEAKVKELTEENREMELEIRGLRDDIADVRELYRTQLNVLLEEKAASLTGGMNGGAKPPAIPTQEEEPQEKEPQEEEPQEEETPVKTQKEEQ